MSNNDVTPKVPTDAEGNVFNRAMGVPVVSDAIAITNIFVDIFDLSAYPGRAFIGISAYNPNSTALHNLEIAIGKDFSAVKRLSIQPSGFAAFDNQLFGAADDPAIPGVATKVRARMAIANGTLASMTINYDNTGSPIQPTNGMCVYLNSIVYEFSSDASAAPGNVRVDIGVSADASWSALVAAVNAYDQSLTLTINTTTNIVTVKPNYAGNVLVPTADGNAVAANKTNAVFSGATTTGGSGGDIPIITIW